MRIRNLYIRNFRGFEDRGFALNNQFTVAIGNNGLGKSTLLHALQVSLGAFLQSMPTLPAQPIYRRQFRKGERFLKFYANGRGFISNKEHPMVITQAVWENTQDKIMGELEWIRIYLPSNTTTHNKEHSQKVIDYANYLYDHQSDLEGILYPVLANFQINRTNAQVKKVDKSWKRMPKLWKGYYAALGESVDFSGVYEWLRSYDKCIEDKAEFPGTREAMFQAIKTAIPYVKKVEFDSKFDEFEVVVNFGKDDNDRRLFASLLSDGMKAMLYMVAEIAYRCIMLNGKLGVNAVTQSPGVVLIDEIDMHLHPKWQRRVISDLKIAFPNIQFVATTHSPFIVQSIKSDELINLDEVEGLDQDPDQYSIEEVSEQEMGVDDVERSEEFLKMQEEAAKYFELIGSNASKAEIEIAKEQLDRLRIKYNSNPAYVALLEAEFPKNL